MVYLWRAVDAEARSSMGIVILAKNRRFPSQFGSATYVLKQFTLSFRDVEDLLAERGILFPMRRYVAG
jgi:transposase-like protein